MRGQGSEVLALSYRRTHNGNTFPLGTMGQPADVINLGRALRSGLWLGQRRQKEAVCRLWGIVGKRRPAFRCTRRE